MALNQNDEIRNEANTCMSYTQKFSKNDQLWLDTMVALKTKNFDRVKKNLLTDVEYTLNDDEMSRVWLKTGLFVNKESELLKVLAAIPESSYQSKKIREIIALMYLRRGEKEKALMFVDDIDSANAENIKGNINLQNKEYELAFGHFKLALQKKNDSENSLERAIPLSWILNQFEDGASMLKKVSYRKNLDPRKVDAINIAFLIRLKKFEVAQKELLILKNKFQNVPPFEVNIMDNYVNLLLSDNTVNKVKFDKRKMEDSTDEACKSFDGLSCWMGLSQLMWDNLGRTIKRDDEIYSDKNLTLETMKTKKEINPLKETITIDQKDIEELDSEAVQIN
jgi:tetratricopeptide (TPR) repeat protein